VSIVRNTLSGSGKIKILEWVCPKCEFDNEKGSAFCGECGKPLKKPCYKCSSQIRWDLKMCPKCGFGLNRNEKVLFVYNLSDSNQAYITVTSDRLLTSFSPIFGGDNVFTQIPLEDIIMVKAGKKKALSNKRKYLDWVYMRIGKHGNPLNFFMQTEKRAADFVAAVKEGQKI